MAQDSTTEPLIWGLLLFPIDNCCWYCWQEDRYNCRWQKFKFVLDANIEWHHGKYRVTQPQSLWFEGTVAGDCWQESWQIHKWQYATDNGPVISSDFIAQCTLVWDSQITDRITQRPMCNEQWASEIKWQHGKKTWLLDKSRDTIAAHETSYNCSELAQSYWQLTTCVKNAVCRQKVHNYNACSIQDPIFQNQIENCKKTKVVDN